MQDCKWHTNLLYIISFSILGDIPSTPGDLFSFILLILLATTSGVTTNCPNLSPSDQLNFVSGTLVQEFYGQKGPFTKQIATEGFSTVSGQLISLL